MSAPSLPSDSGSIPSPLSPAEVAERYYRASGRVPFTGTLVMLTLGVIGAFFLAPLYAVGDYYATYDKLRVCAAFFYAAAIGGWVYYCSYLGKVRSRAFAGLVGVAIGGFALYFAWTWFLCLLAGWEFGLLLIGPAALWEMIQLLAQQGLWTRHGNPVGPTELMLWWSAEAVTIVGTAACLAAQQSRPFCEACGRWTKKAATQSVAVPTSPTLKADLEAERYEPLKALIRLPAAANLSTVATLYSCPDCDESHYLDLGVVSKDQENASGYQILKQLSIPAEVAEWIKDPSLVFEQEA